MVLCNDVLNSERRDSNHTCSLLTLFHWCKPSLPRLPHIGPGMDTHAAPVAPTDQHKGIRAGKLNSWLLSSQDVFFLGLNCRMSVGLRIMPQSDQIGQVHVHMSQSFPT